MENQNRLTDAGGKALPLSDALSNIESAVRYISNSQPEDGLESEIEARGRQIMLDTIADALAVLAKRAEQAQKPVAVSS